MKTDELIAALSRNVEPVDRGLIRRTVGLALVTAVVLALGLMTVWLGIRADSMTLRAAVFLATKVAFARAIIGIASIYLLRLARRRASGGSTLGRGAVRDCHFARSRQTRIHAEFALERYGPE
ncbi:putative membrane protein of unknown function (plasmid) [Bradyrhizobium sp. BTAi1]|nr:NrsF family protein [Bradyrhizobium sp. BTAi1]ABQ39737.1 putative membrane protein of unknown function [Bradyrhizobium sp. BTAi1]